MQLSSCQYFDTCVHCIWQARSSDDYSPGNDQWKIGLSSMFTHALGVAPFKDNFWTTTSQPGDPYGGSSFYFD